MLVTLLVVTPYAVVLAILAVAAYIASRRSRVSAAGGPSVSPVRHEPAVGAAVPVITGLPEREERQPFGGSGIVTAGEGRREAAKP